jgi:regulator of protease activity HflC (stomatin/prohibitin superfamily)
VKRIINFVSLAVIVIFLLPGMCFDRIEPGFIGVRRSLEGGVAEEDFHAGYHVSLPLWHSWYQIDGTLYYLEFTEDNNSALDVRTKDNNIIFIDVAIPYRIQDGKAWMIVREGFADSYEDKAKSTAAGVLREQLAAFSNIDVQKPEVRQQAADGALPALNKALEQYHLVATHVVIRSIRFRQQYEDQLQNKQFFIVQGRLDEAASASRWPARRPTPWRRPSRKTSRSSARSGTRRSRSSRAPTSCRSRGGSRDHALHPQPPRRRRRGLRPAQGRR